MKEPIPFPALDAHVGSASAIRRLEGQAKNFLGNWKDAEDAVCEAIFIAYRSGHTYDPAKGAIADWFFIILKRVCLREITRRTKAPKIFSLTSSTGEGSDSGAADLSGAALGADRDLPTAAEALPSASVLDADETESLVTLFQRFLDEDDQKLFVALFVCDMPREAVAAYLAISDDALRARISRARKDLQEAIGLSLGDDMLERLRRGRGLDEVSPDTIRPALLRPEDVVKGASRARAALDAARKG